MSLISELQASRKRCAELERTVDRLSRWNAEARKVIEQWDEVFYFCGVDHEPSSLGLTKQQVVIGEIIKLRKRIEEVLDEVCQEGVGLAAPGE